MDNVLDFILTVAAIAGVLLLVTLPFAALAFMLIEHITEARWFE